MISEDEAVGKIIKDSRDRRRSRVADDRQDSPDGHSKAAAIKKGEVGSAGDRDSISNYFADDRVLAQSDIEEAIGVKGQRTKDGKCAGTVKALAGGEECAITGCSLTDRDRASDRPITAQCAGVYIYRASASAMRLLYSRI